MTETETELFKVDINQYNGAVDVLLESADAQKVD